MCLIGPVGVTFMLYINHCIGRNFHTDAGKEVKQKKKKKKSKQSFKSDSKQTSKGVLEQHAHTTSLQMLNNMTKSFTNLPNNTAIVPEAAWYH